MKILLATDAFPPVCGGSGWSTYELARGLRARGHQVVVLQPRPGREGTTETTYEGFRVIEFGAPAPNVPYVRNYFKSERLTKSLSAFVSGLVSRDAFELVHGQHVMTGVAAIEGAHAARVPAVVTVRDYWPVCYWSDLRYTTRGLDLCPECGAGPMARCLAPRAGVLWPVALPMIPYMRANLAAKREGLSKADAVIAVSRRIATDLAARAPELARTRIEIIPNAVNIAGLAAAAAERSPNAPAGPYALYVGKLAPNKGTDYLVPVMRRAGLDWPLVVAGTGPGRTALERDARAAALDVRFTGWVDNDEAARLIAHASMLIFPSRGPESLSRVLLEASALGVPIAAMDTGGTRDIIEPGVTGLLSQTPEGLADDVRRLRQDAGLRARLGDAARGKIARDFDAPAVAARVEALYQGLLGHRR